MKFFISRASLSSESCKSQPCDEAYFASYTIIDTRSVDDPSKIQVRADTPHDWWYKKGKNHRIIDGWITRDLDYSDWFIDINSLEDLVNLQKKYGDLIVGYQCPDTGISTIEIYDCLRE